MEEKPRLAKDIDVEEAMFIANGREVGHRERIGLLRKLAFAIESGRPAKFQRLRQKFRKDYGDFNEYEKAGLDGLQKAYMKGAVDSIFGIVLQEHL